MSVGWPVRFLRSKRLRNVLYASQAGLCARCGRALDGRFHADHVVPWCVTGDTNVHDMQALCASCNLTKGSTMPDRKHQAELRDRLSEKEASDLPLSILAWVVPGGGKSRLPGILAQRFPSHKLAWFVPRVTLQTQAVKGMAADFGITLRDSGNDSDPSRGTRGFVATHAALMEQPALWASEFRRTPYLLVVDEHHHAKLDRDETSRPLARALARLEAPVKMFMTGTLETNDNTLIYGGSYEAVDGGQIINPENSADVYIRYDRATALRERAIVPIEFHHHDGPVKWKQTGADETEIRLSDVKREDEGAALYTALRTELAVQLFDCGLDHWRRNSCGGKLIVVTDRKATAREFATRLESARLKVSLAVDDEPGAHQNVENFRRKDGGIHALVTCQMAYEGLDVPEASHVICLTHIRSAPWIEQMLARVWRFTPRKSRCWAFVPDDPRMNRVVDQIAKEQLSVVPDLEEDGEKSPGTGTKPEPILALGGSVDRVRQEFLDGLFADLPHDTPATQRLLDLVRELGLSGDEPEVAALVARLNVSRPPTHLSATLGEQENLLRKQIADACRDIDGERARSLARAPEWGESQRNLFRLTGKSIKDMTLEELKRAHTKLQSLRS